MMLKAKKITLPNGLRIVLAPQKSSMAATALVLVEAGSEYETKNINGLSHFLEHLCFNGTLKRPRQSQISEELDSLGAEYNAFTSQEFTGYWAKADYLKLPRLLELIADLYLNPIFDVKEIDRERGVVIEEINMYEDMPMRKVHDLFFAATYGDQPAGWDIVGRKEVINKLMRQDFIKYRSKRYVAPATAVIIAGNFNEEKTVRQINKLFGALPKKRKFAKTKVRESQTLPRALHRFKESDQSHFVLGVRAFNVFDERRYAAQVLADVLGGGMSSRLFRKVRGEMGAAYYVRAGADFFLDHGHINVAAGVNHKKIKEVIKTTLVEMERLKREPVGDDELQRSKDHLVGGMILGLETSDELANFYGASEILTKKITEPKTHIAKVRAVTAADIMRVARDFFKNERLNLALIGPYKSVARFKKILKFKK